MSISNYYLMRATFIAILAAGLYLPAGVCAAQPGSVDATFAPNPGVDQSVFAIAAQSDGKIVIGGDFTTVNGTSRNYIARLHANGSLDTNFNLGGADDLVAAIAPHDGKLVIGGYFTTVNGTPRASIARLNGDGGLDSAFDPGGGADGPVLALAVQADGKVLIGGAFTDINSTPRFNIARLNTNGLVDATFNAGVVGSGEFFAAVNAIAVQTNGLIVIGGSFTSVDGTPRPYIARLNSAGGLDSTFNANVGVAGAGLLAGVNALAITPEGKILLAGEFTSVNGVARTNIARLNTDGSLDMTFNPGTGPDLAVSSMALQNNGKAVIGGFFTKVNGTPRNYIARLDTSGILDGTFDPGTAANDPVYATALQQDGNVLVGGAFTNFNGVMLHGIARLHGDPVPVAPRLLGPMRSGNTFSASIATVSGKRYILQFKNHLSDPDWTSLPPVQGDGGIKLLQDTNANAANRFYRVRIE